MCASIPECLLKHLCTLLTHLQLLEEHEEVSADQQTVCHLGILVSRLFTMAWHSQPLLSCSLLSLSVYSSA